MTSRELKLLENLAKKIVSMRELGEVFQSLSDQLVDEHNFRFAVVSQFTPEKKAFRLLGISPFGAVLKASQKILGIKHDAQSVYPSNPDSRIFNEFIKKGRRWVGTDVAEFLKPYATGAKAKVFQKILGIKCIYNAPLIAQQGLIGTIVVAVNEPEFTKNQLEFLDTITRHAALAIRQAELISENQWAVKRFRLLDQIDSDILQQKDPQKVLQSIVRNVSKLIECDLAGIYLMNHERNILTPQVFLPRVAYTQLLRGFEIPAGKGIIGSVALTMKAEIVNNAQQDSRSVYPKGGKLKREHLICVPVVGRDRLLGVLNIARLKGAEFIEGDLELAKLFAEKSALALDNAQLLRDIGEHAEALRKSEEQYRRLVESANDGVILMDTQGNFQFVNKQIAEISGYAPEELVGRRFDFLVHPEDRDMMLERFAGRVRGKDVVPRYRFRIVTRSNQIRTIETNVSVIREQDEVVAVLGVGRDVTEEVELQKRLVESEEKYRGLFERSKDTIYITKPDGTILDINQSGVELFGYSSREEIINRVNAQDLYDDKRDRLEFIRLIGGSGFIKDHLIRLRARTGRLIFAEVSATTLRDEAGTAVAYQGIIRDVTNQQEHEMEMAAWRQRYDLIVASSGQVVYEYDIRTKGVLWSGSIQKVLGYSLSEMGGGLQQWEDLLHPDDRPEALRLLEKAEQSLSRYDVEYRFKTKSGTYVWMHDRGFFIADDSGKAYKMLGMMRDIDAQKQLEERVRSSELKHRLLFEHANDAVFLIKGDVFIECNPRALEMFGCQRRDILQRTFYSFSPPHQPNGNNSKAEISQKLRAARAGIPQEFEWRHVRMDGTRFDADVRFNKLEFEGEALIQAQVRNITRELEAQEELARSEENYRLLVQEAADAILVTDGEGRFIEVNDKACSLFGHSREEFLSMVVGDIIESPAEKSHARYRRFYAALLAGGSISASSQNLKFKRKDGTTFFYEINAVLLPNGLMQSIIRDITARKQAEQELEQVYNIAVSFRGTELFDRAAQTIAELLNMHNVVIGELLPDGKTLDALSFWRNGEISRNFRHAIEHTPCRDIAATKAPCFIAEGIQKSFGQESLYAVWHIESFVGVPLLESGGRVIGVVNAFDGSKHRFTEHEKKLLSVIAQRIAAELEMLKQRKREDQLARELMQSQKMESLGTLAGGVAHDFNNILSGVLGYTSLMKKQMDPTTKAFAQLDAIEKSAQRAAGLSKQLLGFAQKAQGEMKPILLNEIVTETLHILESSFPKSIAIQTKLASGLPMVKGDPSQLSQVMMNICINARDSMVAPAKKQEGGVLTIETSAFRADKEFAEKQLSSPRGEFVLLTIADTGRGMTPDVQHRIFEPFFTTKEKGKGTGLGLSMVYGIVRNHQGFIDVESRPHVGTTFRVYLPITNIVVQPEKESKRETPPEKGSGETILVVDDEPVLRQLVSEILNDHGYSVLTASNGREAIEVFHKECDRVNLVILDMIMPELDGPKTFEALSIIKQDVKVLISSGFSQDDSVKQVLDKGALGFVAKPYRSDELLTKVAIVLNGKDADKLL